MSREKPNILFMMTDHQRADSLGAVQAGVEVTPNLNRLASEGTVFSRAYNTCPLCVPARTALATGTYPTKNGVVHNDWRGERAGDRIPLHQVLAEGGYTVGHVGVDHVRVKPELQARVPFHTFVSNPYHRQYLKDQGIDDSPAEGMEAFRKPIDERLGQGRQTKEYSNSRTALWSPDAAHFLDNVFADKAKEFLHADHAAPFALFVCLWAPHPPLRVPEPFLSTFDPERIDLPPNVGEIPDGEPPNRRRGVAGQLGEGVSMEEWRRAWSAHLGLTHLADAAMGGILEALDGSGRADDTAVLFMSDHGDHMGQHRMYQKMEMYEPAVRVPMVVRTPDPVHQNVDRVVSHLDMMPTVLELAGLDAPDDLDGRSLAGAVRSGNDLEVRPAFCQYSGCSGVGDIRRAVVTQRHKYVYDPDDDPELYDLESDPLEMTNLAGRPEHRELVGSLHETCREWGEGHGDWVGF